jgi:putative ABC transport system substrate-binding protein
MLLSRHTRRREFAAFLSACVLLRPMCALSQQGTKLPTIGFLGPATAAIARERTAAFEERLREVGWALRRDVIVEYRWAEGRPERFEELAKELATQSVDVIVTWGTATAMAAKRATSAIPIVFTIVGDPVGSGLVASLASPGGNVTGLSTQHADAAGKRLELIREVLPGLRRLAIMVNVENSGGVLELREAEAAARKLGVEPYAVPVRRAEDIDRAFDGLGADALYVVGDALFNTNRSRINTLAVAGRLRRCIAFERLWRQEV